MAHIRNTSGSFLHHPGPISNLAVGRPQAPLGEKTAPSDVKWTVQIAARVPGTCYIKPAQPFPAAASPTQETARRQFLVSSPPFPLLQFPRAKGRRSGLPASIPPVLLLSGGRFGAEDGGGLRNRCAVVYRLVSILSRSSVCSPTLFIGGAWFCRGGLCSFAACVSRRRRRGGGGRGVLE